MAKRKQNDCSLNEIIGEYLKRSKYGKTLKSFNEKTGDGSLNDSSSSANQKMLEKFFKHLKEAEKENRNDDDLGFEINFGVYQPEPKVSF